MENREEKLTHEQDDRLLELLNTIEISSTIDQMAEELRVPIKERVQQRIRRTSLLRKVWFSSAAAILVVVLGSLGWLTTNSIMQEKVQYITQAAPNGIKTEIMLPDGSTVWLNGGTKLKYPTRFSGKQRAVELNGEAYFNVVPNPKCQFTVTTECVKVTVYGTTFNVNAHTDDNQVKVTLESGRVSVDVAGSKAHHIALYPGQQMSYDKATGELLTRSVQVNHSLSWRDNQFYFEAESLIAIAKQLERTFNTAITIDSELSDIRFSGEFVNGENLEQILHVISTDERIQYAQQKNTIRIYKRQ